MKQDDTLDAEQAAYELEVHAQHKADMLKEAGDTAPSPVPAKVKSRVAKRILGLETDVGPLVKPSGNIGKHLMKYMDEGQRKLNKTTKRKHRGGDLAEMSVTFKEEEGAEGEAGQGTGSPTTKPRNLIREIFGAKRKEGDSDKNRNKRGSLAAPRFMLCQDQELIELTTSPRLPKDYEKKRSGTPDLTNVKSKISRAMRTSMPYNPWREKEKEMLEKKRGIRTGAKALKSISDMMKDEFEVDLERMDREFATRDNAIEESVRVARNLLNDIKGNHLTIEGCTVEMGKLYEKLQHMSKEGREAKTSYFQKLSEWKKLQQEVVQLRGMLDNERKVKKVALKLVYDTTRRSIEEPEKDGGSELGEIIGALREVERQLERKVEENFILRQAVRKLSEYTTMPLNFGEAIGSDWGETLARRRNEAMESPSKTATKILKAEYPNVVNRVFKDNSLPSMNVQNSFASPGAQKNKFLSHNPHDTEKHTYHPITPYYESNGQEWVYGIQTGSELGSPSKRVSPLTGSGGFSSGAVTRGSVGIASPSSKVRLSATGQGIRAPQSPDKSAQEVVESIIGKEAADETRINEEAEGDDAEPKPTDDSKPKDPEGTRAETKLTVQVPDDSARLDQSHAATDPGRHPTVTPESKPVHAVTSEGGGAHLYGPFSAHNTQYTEWASGEESVFELHTPLNGRMHSAGDIFHSPTLHPRFDLGPEDLPGQELNASVLLQLQQWMKEQLQGDLLREKNKIQKSLDQQASQFTEAMKSYLEQIQTLHRENEDLRLQVHKAQKKKAAKEEFANQMKEWATLISKKHEVILKEWGPRRRFREEVLDEHPELRGKSQFELDMEHEALLDAHDKLEAVLTEIDDENDEHMRIAMHLLTTFQDLGNAGSHQSLSTKSGKESINKLKKKTRDLSSSKPKPAMFGIGQALLAGAKAAKEAQGMTQADGGAEGQEGGSAEEAEAAAPDGPPEIVYNDEKNGVEINEHGEVSMKIEDGFKRKITGLEGVSMDQPKEDPVVLEEVVDAFIEYLRDKYILITDDGLILYQRSKDNIDISFETSLFFDELGVQLAESMEEYREIFKHTGQDWWNDVSKIHSIQESQMRPEVLRKEKNDKLKKDLEEELMTHARELLMAKEDDPDADISADDVQPVNIVKNWLKDHDDEAKEIFKYEVGNLGQRIKDMMADYDLIAKCAEHFTNFLNGKLTSAGVPDMQEYYNMFERNIDNSTKHLIKQHSAKDRVIKLANRWYMNEYRQRESKIGGEMFIKHLQNQDFSFKQFDIDHEFAHFVSDLPQDQKLNVLRFRDDVQIIGMDWWKDISAIFRKFGVFLSVDRYPNVDESTPCPNMASELQMFINHLSANGDDVSRLEKLTAGEKNIISSIIQGLWGKSTTGAIIEEEEMESKTRVKKSINLSSLQKKMETSDKFDRAPQARRRQSTMKRGTWRDEGNYSTIGTQTEEVQINADDDEDAFIEAALGGSGSPEVGPRRVARKASIHEKLGRGKATKRGLASVVKKMMPDASLDTSGVGSRVAAILNKMQVNTRNPAKPLRVVMQWILELYLGKSKADDMAVKFHNKRQTMMEYTFSHFLLKLGLKTVAAKRVKELVNSVVKLSDQSSRVRTFARFYGLHENPHLNELNFFIYMFGLFEGKFRETSDGFTYVNIYAALDIFEKVFRPIPRNIIRDKIEKIRGILRLDQAAGKEAGKKLLRTDLDLDNFLDVCMEIWNDRSRDYENQMRDIFNQIDVDKSGTIDLNEFDTFCKRILPEMGEHERRTLFMEAMEKSSGDALNQQAFFRLAEQHGLYLRMFLLENRASEAADIQKEKKTAMMMEEELTVDVRLEAILSRCFRALGVRMRKGPQEAAAFIQTWWRELKGLDYDDGPAAIARKSSALSLVGGSEVLIAKVQEAAQSMKKRGSLASVQQKRSMASIGEGEDMTDDDEEWE